MKNNKITETSEEPTTKPLKTNIPDNPFMVGDGSDGIERDNELTTKQSMMFFDFPKQTLSEFSWVPSFFWHNNLL